MFKTFIATLILATASVALTSKVNAGPNQYPTHQEIELYGPRLEDLGWRRAVTSKDRGAARFDRSPVCS